MNVIKGENEAMSNPDPVSLTLLSDSSGAASTIRRFRPHIYAEIEGGAQDSKAIVQHLREVHGYSCRPHSPSLYRSENEAGEERNVFPGLKSMNTLCVAMERVARLPEELHRWFLGQEHTKLTTMSNIAAALNASTSDSSMNATNDTMSARYVQEMQIAHREISEGRNQRAVEIYERWNKILPKDARSAFNLGVALANLGETERAIEAYRKAWRIEGAGRGAAEAWNNIGVLKLEKTEYRESQEAFRKAVSLSPGYADPVENLKICEREERRTDHFLRVHAHVPSTWGTKQEKVTNVDETPHQEQEVEMKLPPVAILAQKRGRELRSVLRSLRGERGGEAGLIYVFQDGKDASVRDAAKEFGATLIELESRCFKRIPGMSRGGNDLESDGTSNKEERCLENQYSDPVGNRVSHNYWNMFHYLFEDSDGGPEESQRHKIKSVVVLEEDLLPSRGAWSYFKAAGTHS